MPRLPFSTPLPVLPLIRTALDLPEAGWVETDGDKDELAQVPRGLTDDICESIAPPPPMLHLEAS